jgi:hypothetical protein
LQEVDRLDGGGSGYAAWTDAGCRRVNVWYDPDIGSISGPAVHAFGPWMKLQGGCGEPRPCVVYQGAVSGGMLTFSTWQLAPRLAATILRTVKTGTS